jgi:hypothetical protein
VSDISEFIRRPRHLLDEIELPDGDVYIKRKIFAKKKVGVSTRTVRRMNLPTAYFGGEAYVKQRASLQILADQATRKNQPHKRRAR